MNVINKYLRTLTEQDDIYDKIIKFFTANPNPDDDKVHKFAEDIGMEHDDLEKNIYAVLTSIINPIGKHRHVHDSEYNSNELKMGIKVELEHTDSKIISKEIAKDHLAECSDYYTRLERMEEECKT